MAPPAPVRPVGRARRRRATGLALAVVLLVLVGRGLGWFGDQQPAGSGTANDTADPSGGRPEVATPAVQGAAASGSGGESAPAAPAPTPPPPAPSGEIVGTVGAAVPPDGVAAPAQPAEPTGEPASEPNREPATPVATFDADRFAVHLALLQHSIDEGRLGTALATLTQLAAQPLDGAQQAALLTPRQQLADALAARSSQVVAQLGRGEVLAAHASIALLASDGEAFVHDVLQQALRAAGADGALLGPRRESAESLPIARPLPRGRELRVRIRSGLVAGRVVDSRSDQLTVRIENPGGVAFPTVPVVAAEPVSPTADEAVELGFAALQAGEVLLARAWLATARLRARESVPERLPRLAAVLP